MIQSAGDIALERVLVVAFHGWSDAGGASTTAAKHLATAVNVDILHEIGCEGFVDMQMYRPTIAIDDDGERVIEWPDSRLLGPVNRPNPALFDATIKIEDEKIDHPAALLAVDGAPIPELFFFDGTEPAHLWQSYADEFLNIIDTWDFDLVIMIGSMFSDSPHSRPIPITLTSEQPEVRANYDAEKPDYEGPVGIISILNQHLVQQGVATLSLWAQVPHYVHSTPSPKATLALLDRLEEILNVVIPRGTLLEDATAWEANIDNLASQDSEMTTYIERLEEARDSFEGPSATGEAIAYELEKFLRNDSKDDDGSSGDKNDN